MSAVYFCIGDVVGQSVEDCAIVAYRSRFEDFSPDDPQELEYAVVRRHAGRAAVVRTGLGTLAAWCAPDGTMFLSSSTDGLLEGRAGADGAYEWTQVPGLIGVGQFFGLSSTDVFAWGSVRPWSASQPVASYMYRRGPAGWSRIEGPGAVRDVHGSAPDSLFAVGEHGLIARWEQDRWRVLPPPVGREALDHVSGVGPDRAYATNYAGRFFEATSARVTRHARTYPHLHGVAAWQGQVVVAAGELGLWSLRGKQLAAWRPRPRCHVLRRGSTLMCADFMGIEELTAEASAGRSMGWSELDALLGASHVAEPTWCSFL